MDTHTWPNPQGISAIFSQYLHLFDITTPSCHPRLPPTLADPPPTDEDRAAFDHFRRTGEVLGAAPPAAAEE